ncbi:MAG: metal-sensitive transcriptional regulator [Kastovskya adunca ATA6-11-RM4]|jgi:DNA-binding FrmR family transcriptional regulator|nr:metal-sensitive transcriptional regulator [Kastovskya adunca ATA6-11-RM4]
MPHSHSHTQTQAVLNRLAKIKGHVEAIQKMVQAERSCPEVIVQIVAVRSALNKVAKILLKDHAEHCLVDAAEQGDFESELESFRKALDLII